MNTSHGFIFLPRPILPVFAFAFFFGGVALVPGATEVQIVKPAERRSTNGEGVVTLEWRADSTESDLRFELQQSADENFADARTRYLGPDRASVLSGFPEGIAHFRVRAIGSDNAAGPWSEPVSVETAYMPRRTVWLMLGAGSAIFLATLGTLFVGHCRHRFPT